MKTVKFALRFLVTLLIVLSLNFSVLADLSLNFSVLAKQFEEKIEGAYFLNVQDLADDQNFSVPVYVIEGGVFKEGYVRVVGQPDKSQVCFKNFSIRHLRLKINGNDGPVLEPVPQSSQKKDVTVCVRVTYTPNKSGKKIVNQIFSGREVIKKD